MYKRQHLVDVQAFNAIAFVIIVVDHHFRRVEAVQQLPGNSDLRAVIGIAEVGQGVEVP